MQNKNDPLLNKKRVERMCEIMQTPMVSDTEENMPQEDAKEMPLQVENQWDQLVQDLLVQKNREALGPPPEAPSQVKPEFSVPSIEYLNQPMNYTEIKEKIVVYMKQLNTWNA